MRVVAFCAEPVVRSLLHGWLHRASIELAWCEASAAPTTDDSCVCLVDDAEGLPDGAGAADVVFALRERSDALGVAPVVVLTFEPLRRLAARPRGTILTTPGVRVLRWPIAPEDLVGALSSGEEILAAQREDAVRLVRREELDEERSRLRHRVSGILAVPLAVLRGARRALIAGHSETTVLRQLAPVAVCDGAWLDRLGEFGLQVDSHVEKMATWTGGTPVSSGRWHNRLREVGDFLIKSLAAGGTELSLEGLERALESCETLVSLLGHQIPRAGETESEGDQCARSGEHDR